MAPRLAYLLKKFPRLSETFVLGEILGQERLGAELHVFSRRTPDDEPRHPELASLRASVEHLPPSREIDPWSALLSDDGQRLVERIRDVLGWARSLEHPRLPSLLAEAIWLRRRCEELDIGHVHVHFATDSAVTAMLLRGLGGPGYSITAHAKDIYRDTVHPRLLERLIGDSEFTVTVCDANVEHLRGLLSARAMKRVRRLYNGIDVASFTPAGSESREPGHILSVGRLVEKKGFDVLLEALALLRDRAVDFRATIVGDGDQKQALEAQIRALGLNGRVTLTGALDQGRLRTHLATSEVFCLPCVIGEDGNRDALPTVLLEAQAAGLPIVSTPVSGVPEILDHGRAGLLVSCNDAPGTARALEDLLGDPHRRRWLSERGLEHVAKNFELRRNSQVLRQWFDQALERGVARCGSPT